MLVRSPSVTRLAEEGEERPRWDRVGCEETPRAMDGEGENFKREREDYLRARVPVCVCMSVCVYVWVCVYVCVVCVLCVRARVCKAREKGRQNRSGSEGDEGGRPWVTRKGEVGCRRRADARAYERGGR